MPTPDNPPRISSPHRDDISRNAGAFERVLSFLRRRPPGATENHAPSRGPEPQPASETPPAPKPPRCEPKVAEFNRLLERTLSSNPSVTAGQVQFIGLGRLRDYLGSDWETEKEKVHAAADSVIRSHLVKGDMHQRIDDVSFVVVFASLGQDAARVKCAMIANAIVKRMIGTNDDLSFVNVRTAVLKENGKIALQQITDLESLLQHMAKLPADDPDELSTAWPTADPGNRRRQLEWILRTTEYRFQPLWCVTRGTIFLYRVIAARPTRSDGVLYSYRLLPCPDDPDAILELDLRCAQRAVLELNRSQDTGPRHLIGLRVHFETAASVKRRLRLIQVLQSAPEHLRQYLVATITHIPDGVSQTKINDIVGGFRSFFRLMTATLRGINTNLRPFADAKIYAVGIDLPAAQGLVHVSGLEIRRFCNEAQALNLRTYLHNLSNPVLMRHALAMGFEYIDGDAVAGIVERPAGILNLSAKDLIDY